jgi:phospholipase C
MSGNGASRGIEHIFVLMLENRAFDHMLGFSEISGQDAATGEPTKAAGLTGAECNNYQGQTYSVTRGADFVMPSDPGHEFTDVLTQLAGLGAVYPPAGAYPAINNSGFVASYVATGGSANPAEVMKCFLPEQLPVLNALAREFVLCDQWHASLPGPTWPNRMFVHASSSGGLDHSPTTLEIVEWETVGGFQFANGTIFDALNAKGLTRRLYGDDDFPMVAALKGISLGDIRHFSQFAGDLAQPDYPYNYVFIEPSYDVPDDYRNSTSQHPLTDITLGEGFIKATYEAIRNSALWDSSLLIITWDEHGGFYDHVAPPAALAPGDTAPEAKYNKFGFTFEVYGPRVPAVVVSPLIPKNLIDHAVYDHASVLATVERVFGLNPLTTRDRAANSLDALISLSTPRDDAPLILPAPASSGVSPAAVRVMQPGAPVEAAAPDVQDQESVDVGNLPAVLHSALSQDLQLSSPQDRQAILERFRTIGTRGQARQYLEEVRQKRARATGP